MSRLHGATQQSHISQALRAEGAIASATSQKAALAAAIDAAESYMKALRLASSDDKKQLDSKCKELLTRAERIKTAADWQSVARQNTIISLRAPTSKRKLTTREQIIVLEGAKLNGFIFPPWQRPPEAAEFDKSFIDSPDLHLSECQTKIFAGWKRPSDLLHARNAANETQDAVQPVMSVTGTTDLVQDVLTDCSVIASLCAATSRSERGLGRHAAPVMYPSEQNGEEPSLSLSGKYVFSFYFNGSFRKVVIDDRLPSSNTKRSLHVIDRNNPNFLWPALVEKAYLKVRGGYDFPGSNSGTDLWVLTGWIPEQLFLHNEDATSEQIWGRLYRPFSCGDVVLTIGTGKLTEREQRELGLVSEHDYAILDMKENNGRRQFLLKNPWAGAEPTIIQSSDSALQDPSSPPSPLSPGIFWMDCEQVFQNYENLYLNWNPGLFKFREDIHFTWDLSQGGVMAGCFVKNPQFSVYSETGGTVWLLLGKHFKTDHLQYLKSQNGELGFISIYIFEAGGKRVSLSDGALHRGPYVDSPNTLMRLELPPRTTYTAVISEQSLPLLSQNFTLSALSMAEVSLAPSRDKHLCLNKVTGSWTALTAGGNAESARYSSNPQFSLQVSEKTDVSILLESSEAELATHVKLFWSNGQRIARVRSRDIIADSGDYRRGCALAETSSLDKGVYTIICSTFSPDQLGRFTLWISSSIPCVIQPLAGESAGRRITRSSVGVLTPGQDRMLAPLKVPRLTRIKLIAKNKLSVIGTRPVAPSPVLMTVELGQGPYKETLATSEDGAHCDAVSGVRVEDFDLSPNPDSYGKVWIVLERIGGPGGQVEDHFEVEALAEERVEIGEWIVEDP
ncbi:Peptidase C2 calpain domain III [Penicillium macrosclerotiorum]|uniref:Peptidase C2 calpain domain III n=1 Tax=Penicillium macrosclerotiorum TaxID=303699 RepID=UPI0025468EF6|nr:Peptidase C2 calpain domain III [Penicillium macrosclerotiorum]KAJ5688618.1 Peptidase C2 calpain domain III [Penicillium macrosclerotiorum]